MNLDQLLQTIAAAIDESFQSVLGKQLPFVLLVHCDELINSVGNMNQSDAKTMVKEFAKATGNHDH